MDERRSELTPEQREAALKLAERFSDSPEWSGELARALLDLHAENVRLREALKTGRDDLNHALKYDGGCDREETADVRDALSRALSGSPATEAVTSQRIHDLERELK